MRQERKVLETESGSQQTVNKVIGTSIIQPLENECLQQPVSLEEGPKPQMRPESGWHFEFELRGRQHSTQPAHA